MGHRLPVNDKEQLVTALADILRVTFSKFSHISFVQAREMEILFQHPALQHARVCVFN
jgi:hypothetical protein